MTSRDSELTDFLTEVNAIPGRTQGEFTPYIANGRTFILQHFGANEGWEIYIPASQSNMTKITFNKVRAYLKA